MEYVIPAAIHPIFVHFAIALTVFGAGLDAFALVTGKNHLHQAAKIILIGGGVGIAAAVMSGWWDHESTVHSHLTPNLMPVHQYLGWSLFVIFSVLLVWRVRLGLRPSPAFVGIALIGALGILVQGHIGGQMVFRQGVGVQIDREGQAVSLETDGSSLEKEPANEAPGQGHHHDDEGHEH